MTLAIQKQVKAKSSIKVSPNPPTTPSKPPRNPIPSPTQLLSHRLPYLPGTILLTLIESETGSPQDV